MLCSLHIKNYILIDSLDVTFPEGLVIITGQTGAGKSILLGALSLLSGAKAETSMIGDNGESCVVEAEFVYKEDDEALAAILAQADIDPLPDRHLIIRRTLASSGRSRCFVNDNPVAVGVLQSISARLVDIHSQHRSLLLADRSFQLSLLDSFSGTCDVLKDCRNHWRGLQECNARLLSLSDKLRKVESDRDYNAATIEKLEKANLKEGEIEALEEEHKTLANAEEILSALSSAEELLCPSSPEAEEAGRMGVSAALKEASRVLDRLKDKGGSAVSSLSSRIESVRIEVEDISSELDDIARRVDLSPSRLEVVEERMSFLYTLLKQYSCATVSELITLRDTLKEGMEDGSALEEEISSVTKKRDELFLLWKKDCETLSSLRRKAAPGLSRKVSESLKFLELDRSRFEVSVSCKEGGADGADKVDLLFSSTGDTPSELTKVASGGEMSRIMLSLKALMADYVGMPTLVFDEIDTGVSGSVADRMGRMICSMGNVMQVISITHLPQVAAKGEAHYLVSKSTNEATGKVLSSVRRIEGEERVREIARMLSGERISETALANARTLLSESKMS